MISDVLSFLISYSIGIAAIIGLCRFQRASPDNHPFFYILWLALLSEITGRISTRLYKSTAVNNPLQNRDTATIIFLRMAQAFSLLLH